MNCRDCSISLFFACWMRMRWNCTSSLIKIRLYAWIVIRLRSRCSAICKITTKVVICGKISEFMFKHVLTKFTTCQHVLVLKEFIKTVVLIPLNTL